MGEANVSRGHGVSARLKYEPGLDGIRALALVTVLLFHADFHWIRGGFLSVCLFFTLSGYLITSLLLAEQETNSRISLRDFYGRRLRRLAPASTATILIVLLAAKWITDPTTLQLLPGDAASSLGYIANWRFVWSGQSYAELFATPSPLQHFWTLAVEEQFYIVYPLVMAVALKVFRTRAQLAGFLIGAMSVSVVIGILIKDFDRGYYGTDVRCAEILAGAILAVLCHRRTLVGERVALAIGALSLVAFALLCTTTSQSAGWLSTGGFAAFSIVNCGLIIGVTRSQVLRRSVGWTPFVLIGKISYGMYLAHWPVYLWLSEARVGWGGLPLFAVRAAVTTVIAVVSYRLLECPIRFRRVLRGPELAASAFALSIAATALVAVARVAVDDPAPTTFVTEALAGSAFDESGSVLLSNSTAEPAADVPLVAASNGDAAIAPPAPEELPRVLVLGSESYVAERLDEYSKVAGDLDIVSRIDPTCTVVGTLSTASGDPEDTPPLSSSLAGAAPPPVAVVAELTDAAAEEPQQCVSHSDRWQTAIAEIRPALIVVAVGQAERDAVAFDRGQPIGDPTELFRRTEEATAHIDAAFAVLLQTSLPVLLIDSIESAGYLTQKFQFLELQEPNISRLPLTALDSPHETIGSLHRARLADQPRSTVSRRIMVAGDSTSVGFAEAIFRAGDGTIEVLSTGREGCPIVNAVAVRWWASAEFDATDCPHLAEQWKTSIARFQPDAIVIVASLMEQSEFRFDGDETWHSPGDPAYVAAHESLIDGLMEVVAETATPVVVADAPPISDGAFRESKMATTESVDAWNRQILTWVERWQPVSVMAYSAPLLELEGRVGSQRVDGVHVDLDVLTELARASYLPTIEQLARDAHRVMVATGCATEGETGSRLDLSRCRRQPGS